MIACGLIRATRPMTTMSIPKKIVTSAMPSRAPISPCDPPIAALTATMIAATTAVSTADHRVIRA